MGDAFYALDADWRFIYANQRALEFWNTNASDVIGKVIWQRFPQMVGSLNERVLRQVRFEQRVVTFEAPSPTMGIWVSVNVGPSGDGVSVYWRDISERIEAERELRNFAGKMERQVAERTRALSDAVEELRRSRARYSAIFENSPVDFAFMAVQPDGRIVCEDANPAWERHSGYTRDFVVGRALDEVLPREQAEYAKMQYRRVIESRQPIEYQYTTRFPIGEVSRRSFLVPLPDDDGRISHVLLTSVDLTEMRRVEAQLRQAQKMEAVGQLTGGIAHDFNNLLTAIIGNLELLQNRLTEQRSLVLADAALRSALRGGQLIQQLLAYSRRQNLSPRPVDVNAVITGMSELLQRSLGGLVQVETDLAADLWQATSDPTQLELVVLNLAINSRDAMPDGGRLRIETRNVHPNEVAPLDALEPGDYVCLAVIDTGVRHDARRHGSRLRAILHHEGNRQRQRTWPCTGLRRRHAVRWHGAARQPARCRHHGGSVPAACHGNSRPQHGTGTDAPIDLSSAADASCWLSMMMRLCAGSPLSSCTTRASWCSEADNGPQARDILAAGPVSLALVDYAMPMMSGYEFVSLAREIQPDLPVIYVTGARRYAGLGENIARRSRHHEAVWARRAVERPRASSPCL